MDRKENMAGSDKHFEVTALLPLTVLILTTFALPTLCTHCFFTAFFCIFSKSRLGRLMVDDDSFLLSETETLRWRFLGEINIGTVPFGYVSLDCDVLALCVLLSLVITTAQGFSDLKFDF